MLNGTLSPNAHPSASGPPSAQTPREERVHARAEGGPIVLPREAVDAPRAHDQVERQPDQSCPVRGGRGRHSPAELLSREPQVRAIEAK
eukprot:15341881-Alexandrium_andersonii.AAC.1